jgi:AMP-binding enzyme C-terminal domain
MSMMIQNVPHDTGLIRRSHPWSGSGPPVENALVGAPGVYEAAVLGVPDEMMGEKVAP